MDHVAKEVYILDATQAVATSSPESCRIRLSQAFSTSVQLIELAKRREPVAWEQLAQL